MKRIDLNVDIGEGFPYDEALLEFATSANVCCGEHAGSWELTEQTVALCRARGVRVGAHPGFPDRETMGRGPLPEGKLKLYIRSIDRQITRSMRQFNPGYIKPHGALYNLLVSRFLGGLGALQGDEEKLASGIEVVMLKRGLPWMLLARASEWLGKPMIREGFADRRYTAAGLLVPRTQPDAVLHDPQEIKEQVLRIAPNVDSICLHGDTPGCLEFAELVKKTLLDAGYEVSSEPSH